VHPLAALVAAGLLSAAQAVAGGSGDARLNAETITRDSDGVVHLEGSVVVTRGLIRLRARSASWDPRTSTLEAAGQVLLTDATHAVAAEGLHARLESDFEATDVVVFLKAGPADLAGARDAAEAGACGLNAATARADRLSWKTGGPFRLQRARVTLCGCPDGGPPSWEVRASEARVEAGERVELWWPVVWITPRFLLMDRPVPVLVLPYLSLPLGERVSGLLPTTFGRSGNAGQVLTQPLYLTLGRSADLTVAPRWGFGRKRTAVNPASTSGPGLMLEWRAAPAAGSGGRFQVDALWDLQRPAELRGGLPGASALRLGLSGGWEQRLWDGALLSAGLDLASDPLYGSDFTFDALERGSGARRSTLIASDRRGPVALELSTAWLQPVETDRPWPLPDLAHPDLAMLPGGLFGGRLPAFHRWPSLAATLTPVALPLGLELSGRAGLSRFAPPSGSTSDGGADGVGPADRGLPGGPGARIWTSWQRDPADATELDGRWQPGERLAVTRADVRAELAAPLALGGWLTARPFLRGAALGYRFDAAVSSLANAWGVAGAELMTRLQRRDGEWRQLLEPRLEWRWGSAVAGRALPAFGYDELDRAPAVPAGVDGAAFALRRVAAAAPEGLFHQARLALATRLERSGQELLRASLAQELELQRGRLAELGLSVAAGAQGPLAVEAELRLWPDRRWAGAPTPVHGSWLDRFSEASLRLRARDGRGDTFTAGLAALGAGGSGRLTGGGDALFGTSPTALRPLALANLGVRFQLGAAALAYEVVLPARAQTPFCDASSTRTVRALQPQSHVASVEWESPCRCFRVKAAIRVNDCGGFGFEPSFDLGPIAASVAR